MNKSKKNIKKYKKKIIKNVKKSKKKKNIKQGGGRILKYKHLLFEPIHYAIGANLKLVIKVKITNTINNSYTFIVVQEFSGYSLRLYSKLSLNQAYPVEKGSDYITDYMIHPRLQVFIFEELSNIERIDANEFIQFNAGFWAQDPLSDEPQIFNSILGKVTNRIKGKRINRLCSSEEFKPLIDILIKLRAFPGEYREFNYNYHKYNKYYELIFKFITENTLDIIPPKPIEDRAENYPNQSTLLSIEQKGILIEKKNDIYILNFAGKEYKFPPIGWEVHIIYSDSDERDKLMYYHQGSTSWRENIDNISNELFNNDNFIIINNIESNNSESNYDNCTIEIEFLDNYIFMMNLTKLYIEKYFDKVTQESLINKREYIDYFTNNYYNYLKNVNLYSFEMRHKRTKRDFIFYYKEYEFNISIWNGTNTTGESIGWERYNIPFLILPKEASINEIGLNDCYLPLGFYISKIYEYTHQISESFEEYYSEEMYRLNNNKRYIFFGDLINNMIPIFT